MTKLAKLQYAGAALLILGCVFLVTFHTSKTIPGNEAVLPHISSYTTHYIGVVGSATPLEDRSVANIRRYTQRVSFSVLGKTQEGEWETGNPSVSLNTGQKVLVGVESGDEGESYAILDVYRLPKLYIVFFLFLLVIFLVAGRSSFPSFAGLGFSIIILEYLLVPGLFSQHPYAFVLITAGILVSIGTVLAHGITKVTILAATAAASAFCVAALLSWGVIYLLGLDGSGLEESVMLQSLTGLSSLRAVFFASVVIGTLGVLDDAVITQVESVKQVWKSKPEILKVELYRAGMHVGKQHIAALINTLLLAYASGALPLLMMLYSTNLPWWVVLNSPLVIEEIVRTVIGTSAIILSIPLATYFAAWYFSKKIA
ncbi:MAG TPA: YibE/F family protein [Patescibacteria group bacterium]|nr:YibE/F family protein [Patescibacteria group bacterium]